MNIVTKCLIDLSKNALVFQGGVITTTFLSEGEIEKNKYPIQK